MPTLRLKPKPNPIKSFVFHPLWPKIAPWISIEVYGRDGGPDKPRARIELSGDAPKRIVTAALKLTMPCVACGKPVHPFRTRRKRENDSRSEDVGHIYFAAACERKKDAGCGNGKAASVEYDRIKFALRPDLANSAGDELRLLGDFVAWMRGRALHVSKHANP
jgi:hypothetical protein